MQLLTSTPNETREGWHLSIHCSDLFRLTVRLPLTLRFCFENRFYEMLFNSIFRNVNVTLLCITNTPTIMYAASPEKWSFHSGGGGGEGEGLDPLFLNFLDPPLKMFTLAELSCLEYQTTFPSCHFNGVPLALHNLYAFVWWIWIPQIAQYYLVPM